MVLSNDLDLDLDYSFEQLTQKMIEGNSQHDAVWE